VLPVPPAAPGRTILPNFIAIDSNHDNRDPVGRIFSTTIMESRINEEANWETKLETAGFDVNGIDLSDAGEMKAVLKTLGGADEEYALKSRIRAFIKKKQQRPADLDNLIPPVLATDGSGDIMSALQMLSLEVHRVRQTLPSVLIGHVLTPTDASRNPQAVSCVFDALGLHLSPESTGVTRKLPDNCGDEWKFDWKWPKNPGGGDDGDHRGLERQSYGPVVTYLGKLGLFCVDVSEGKLLC
jgi:hypothetical protein